MKAHADTQTQELPGFAPAPTYRQLGENYRERERVARKVKRWRERLLAMKPTERAAIMAALASIATDDGVTAAAPPPADDAQEGYNERRWRLHQEAKERHRAPWCKDERYVLMNHGHEGAEGSNDHAFAWCRDDERAGARTLRCQHCGHEWTRQLPPPNPYRARILRSRRLTEFQQRQG